MKRQEAFNKLPKGAACCGNRAKVCLLLQDGNNGEGYFPPESMAVHVRKAGGRKEEGTIGSSVLRNGARLKETIQ
jgi:hypothetical protein